MLNFINTIKLAFNNLLAYCGLGMRAKLILLFVIIKVVPLILLALIAWNHSWGMGEAMRERIEILSANVNEALVETGQIATEDTINALDTRATFEFERTTTDLAMQVARFLYARDGDIRFLADMEPNAQTYAAFIENIRGNLVLQSPWELAPDGKKWQPVTQLSVLPKVSSSNKENELRFQYRQPDSFQYETRPLFLEATFITPDGKERIKVTTSPQMNPEPQDVSQKVNTYIKAETYFPQLEKLAPGEIYVSDMIGEYVGSKVIGHYTPENVAKVKIPYEPQKAAWAGTENPLGQRFKGIIRWAMPVEKDGVRLGYVTLVLDHDHIMEIVNHVIPTGNRYTELPDAAEGNYAMLWDYKGRNIVHPRHALIAGYNAETGDPQIPWLEDSIYDAWQASGKSYTEFIIDVPTFLEQSTSKKAAPELAEAGLIGMDCRYANFAPQCVGWFDLTRNGGSGSFVLLWSGFRKLSTGAAIPYYTGQYAAAGAGFGVVAITATMEEFHRPATETQQVLNTLIADSNKELANITEETFQIIADNLLATATSLTVSTILMIAMVILIAIWLASIFTKTITVLINGIARMRRGERHFRFNNPVKDELGALADAIDDSAEALENNVTVPLIILDMTEHIIHMNGHALKRIEKSLEEVLGKPYTQYALYDEEGSIYCPLLALREQREAAILHNPKTDTYVQDKAAYLYDKQEQACGYTITTSDLTDIVYQQRQIDEQSTLLNTMFSASQDLIWLKNIEGRYLYVNSYFAGYVKKEIHELVGKVADTIIFDDPILSKEQDSLVIKSGQTNFIEQRLVFPDKQEKVVDVARIPIFDANGVVVSILGMTRDISQRVHIENELRKTQQFLEASVQVANHANNAKSEFLARMSHEIRTPLNAILGMTGIAQRRLVNTDANPAILLGQLKQIETSSKHLLGLLNDVLDISKIEAGKIDLSNEATDLTKLLDAVITIIQPRCDEKSIRFNVEYKNLHNVLVMTDSLRLNQVLINLLGNAAKFTPEFGEIHFTVNKMKQENTRIFVEFIVSDTGIGIAKDKIEKLFKPFEQADSLITAKYGGTGLGLTISQSIVQILGGEITLETAFGEGSTFRFSLWMEQAQLDVQEASTQVLDTTYFEGKRLLLVDDVDINRIIIIDLLESFNFLIEEAADGTEALQKFLSAPPNYYDLILMDILMPTLNGYDTTVAIRAADHPNAQDIPIIAMTANAFREDINAALLAGMNAHIAKPIDYNILVTHLLQYLTK